MTVSNFPRVPVCRSFILVFPLTEREQGANATGVERLVDARVHVRQPSAQWQCGSAPPLKARLRSRINTDPGLLCSRSLEGRQNEFFVLL
jgi:hypothetical protein